MPKKFVRQALRFTVATSLCDVRLESMLSTVQAGERPTERLLQETVATFAACRVGAARKAGAKRFVAFVISDAPPVDGTFRNRYSDLELPMSVTERATQRRSARWRSRHPTQNLIGPDWPPVVAEI